MSVISKLLQALPQIGTHRRIIAKADGAFKSRFRFVCSAKLGEQVSSRGPIGLMICQPFFWQSLQQRQALPGTKSVRRRDGVADARAQRGSECHQQLIKCRDDGPFDTPGQPALGMRGLDGGLDLKPTRLADAACSSQQRLSVVDHRVMPDSASALQ